LKANGVRTATVVRIAVRFFRCFPAPEAAGFAGADPRVPGAADGSGDPSGEKKITVANVKHFFPVGYAPRIAGGEDLSGRFVPAFYLIHDYFTFSA
jgi:hypothetical protein